MAVSGRGTSSTIMTALNTTDSKDAQDAKSNHTSHRSHQTGTNSWTNTYPYGDLSENLIKFDTHDSSDGLNTVPLPAPLAAGAQTAAAVVGAQAVQAAAPSQNGVMRPPSRPKDSDNEKNSGCCSFLSCR